MRPPLDHVDVDRRQAGVLDGRAADLAVALAGVGVADEQAGAGRAHGQVRDAAGAHVRQVHVAAVVVGRERVDRVQLGRRAQRADVWAVGQRDPVAPVDVLGVDVDLAHPLGQRRVQRGGEGGAGQGAELRDHGARPAGVLATRRHRLDADGERVTLLGAGHHDRPVLRVHERHRQRRAGQIGLGVDHPAEGVAGLDRHAVAGLDLQHRRRVRAHREVELALALLGQLVGRALPTAGDALSGHDRRCRPRHPAERR